MKKFLVLLMAVFTVSAAFSQNYQRDYRSNRSQTVVTYRDGYHTRSQNNGYYDNGRNYNESYRRAEIARINRDYDQRVNRYRNNRYMNSIERERRIREMEYERNQRLKSFGGGVVVGALATLVLGAILSH